MVKQRCTASGALPCSPSVPKLCPGPGSGCECVAQVSSGHCSPGCCQPPLVTMIAMPYPKLCNSSPQIYRVCCQGPPLVVENILVVSWTAFSFPDCWEKKAIMSESHSGALPPEYSIFWGADTLFCITFNLGRYLTTLPQFSMSNIWHRSVYSCFIQLG